MAEGLHRVADDQSEELTVERIGTEILALVADAPDGEGLDEHTRALLDLAVRSCGTTLDLDGTRDSLRRALAAGVSGEEAAEMMFMTSGMGMHGLIGTASIVADVLRESGHPAMGEDFTEEQAAAWGRVGGGDAREARIAQISPDFLPNLVRLVPEPMLKALLDFRAAPWFSTTMTPLQMELVGVAVDTMPSHRFLPTLRMHVLRAVEHGAGRRMIEETLAIAAAAPAHRGVW